MQQNEIINFGKIEPIIQRADGLLIHVDSIKELSEPDKEHITAMYFLKIKQLTKQQLKFFFEQLITRLLKSINSKKTAIEINALHEMFMEEFPVMHPGLSIQEVKLICFGGVRGKYNQDSNLDSILTLSNFSKWKHHYLTKRNDATLKLMNIVNSLPIKEAYDFAVTENQIKTILEIKKKDKDQFEKECVRFSKIVPSFMYDQLVSNRKIKNDAFLKYIDEAKSLLVHNSEAETVQVSNFIEVLYGTDLNDYNSKLHMKAKQIAIYNFIKNHKPVSK